MCTAATYKTKDFYFGRTLDYDLVRRLDYRDSEKLSVEFRYMAGWTAIMP